MYTWLFVHIVLYIGLFEDIQLYTQCISSNGCSGNPTHNFNGASAERTRDTGAAIARLP